MATYLSLLNWTREGAEKIKDSPSRLDAARKLFESAGGKIKSFHLLMGQYDMAVLIEASDDTVLATILLSLASKGLLRSETMRAFPEDEYRKIIASLP